jgi:uncharacterized membrane protein
VDGLDKLLLLLHLTCVVVGIGGVMLNGVYGIQAKNRPGPGGLAITEANEAVSKIAEYFIYGIPVFGILLVLRIDGFEFSQTWIGLSILLYIVALGISHGVMFPTVKKMVALQRELVAMGPPPAGAPAGGPPPQVAQLEAHGKKLGTFGPMLNIIAVAIIGLMIWKPGL